MLRKYSPKSPIKRAPWLRFFELCLFGAFLCIVLDSGGPTVLTVVVVSMLYAMYWTGMHLVWCRDKKRLSVEIDDTAITGPSATTTSGPPVRIPLGAVDMDRTLSRSWRDVLCGYWRIYSKDGSTAIGLSNAKLGSDVVRSVIEDLGRAGAPPRCPSMSRKYRPESPTQRAPWWWLVDVCVFGVFVYGLLNSGLPVVSTVVVIIILYVMYWVFMYWDWRRNSKKLSVEIDDAAITGPSATGIFGPRVRIPLDAVDMERTLRRSWGSKLSGHWRIYSRDGKTIIGLSKAKLGSDVVRSVIEDLYHAVVPAGDPSRSQHDDTNGSE